jgi:outer membrane beta-barrel protein
MLVISTFIVGSFANFCNAQNKIPQRVVQNRQALDSYEWTVSAGSLPLDAFKKGITASGGLTLHYNHQWAWEAVQYTYSFEYKTTLEDELRRFKLESTPFERVESYVTSNVVFKPLYWKGAWLNQSMSYGEFFLLAGGGYGWLSLTSRPVVDGGAGIKLFHTNGIATRLDVRWLTFFNAEDFHHELWVGLGVSL